ncbi:MAG: molecular chaperone DnaJ [Oculatellaceae cyanobacterium Prado106]|jgi:curved DNA-binding protein CbpA|nr:molecular chaperone DnaJ [Oculatellaceae cyanobacterium Prado106]
MTTPHDRLAIPPTATAAEAKAAYHAKLREFPAHSHPTEFKAIREAYEAIRKGEAQKAESFFKPRPLEATLDPDALAQLRSRVVTQTKVTLEDLIRETF